MVLMNNAMCLKAKINKLLLIIQDRGLFNALSPEDAYITITREEYEAALSQLIKNYPDYGYYDIFSELAMCALDAMGEV